MDTLESYLCAVRVNADYTDKNGFAPRGALLAALWGDEPQPESSDFYLSSEAVRTFTGVLLEI